MSLRKPLFFRRKTHHCALQSLSLPLSLPLPPSLPLSLSLHVSPYRLILNQEKHTIEHMVEEGILDNDDAEKAHVAVHEYMKKLYFTPPMIEIPDPVDVLREVPWLKDVGEGVFASVVESAEMKTFFQGQELVRQDEHGDGIYVVLRGTVDVSIHIYGKAEGKKKGEGFVDDLSSDDESDSDDEAHHRKVPRSREARRRSTMMAAQGVEKAREELEAQRIIGEKWLVTIGIGAVIGELGALTGCKATSTVKAATMVECAFFPNKSIQSLLNAFAQLEYNIWTTAGKRIAVGFRATERAKRKEHRVASMGNAGHAMAPETLSFSPFANPLTRFTSNSSTHFPNMSHITSGVERSCQAGWRTFSFSLHSIS